MTHVWLNIELLYHRKGRDQCGPDCVEKVSLFYLFIYGWAGSSLLHGLFYSCGKRGPLSSGGAVASHRMASSVAEHGL